jgi:hypothetical protein
MRYTRLLWYKKRVLISEASRTTIATSGGSFSQIITHKNKLDSPVNKSQHSFDIGITFSRSITNTVKVRELVHCSRRVLLLEPVSGLKRSSNETIPNKGEKNTHTMQDHQRGDND